MRRSIIHKYAYCTYPENPFERTESPKLYARPKAINKCSRLTEQDLEDEFNKRDRDKRRW